MGNKLGASAPVYTQSPRPTRQPTIAQLVSDEDAPKTGYAVAMISSYAPSYEPAPMQLPEANVLSFWDD